jgi:hypothetical protein
MHAPHRHQLNWIEPNIRRNGRDASQSLHVLTGECSAPHGSSILSITRG